MRQTAVEWLIAELIKTIDYDNSQNVEDLRIKLQSFIITSEKHAKEMDMQQKKDAYQHGRDDENCALSDGAMAPDYDNADEWYKGEYGGEA